MPNSQSVNLFNEPVVISGMGLATSLGLTVEENWLAILDNRTGAGVMDAMESPLPPGRDGCQAPPLPDFFEPTLPREARYLRWTILAAMKDAGAEDHLPYDSSRCAILLGTTLHGMRAGGRFLRSGDFGELQNFLAGDTLRLATSGLGFGGGAATTCSACSSSLGSIALAMTLLRTGQADLVVAGGYDTISEYAWGGFNALRLVTDGPLRPFARGRTGMKLGEGYGIVILERQSDALKRKVTPRATIIGYGESADAHHLTQPHPAGQGAQRAMIMALDRSRIAAGDLGLIAAHATGTPDNDSSEYAALSSLLGDHLPQVPVICFKSHLGHTLGGAGAAELILSAMSLQEQTAPACANISADEIEFPNLKVMTGQPLKRPIEATLNTSLGFGGANTCVVLGKDRPAPLVESKPPREVWITGIGVLLPGMVGNQAFVDRLKQPTQPIGQQPFPALDDGDLEQLINARRVRRMSAYAKFTLAAAALACRDGGLEGKPELLADCCALLGTAHGSGTYCYDYYSQIVREGVLAANPMLFAEGVPNAGAAHLSLMLGLHGACQTLIGSRTAGLDALRLAWLRIAGGEWDRAIVGAAEENHFAIEKAYDHCGLRNQDATTGPFDGVGGFVSNQGAVSLVLESRESALARGAIPYARIEQAHSQSGDRPQLVRTLSRLLDQMPIAPHVICSANGTWLDSVEAGALVRATTNTAIGSIYDLGGEVFSATPLLGIAATLLCRSLPLPARLARDAQLRWADPLEPVNRLTVLCSDWNGNATAATLEVIGDRSGLP